jgi:hypothetical protein
MSIDTEKSTDGFLMGFSFLRTVEENKHIPT